MTASKKTTRPRPPEELDGEALLEWQRVCDELDEEGRLSNADRAILTLYVETWSVYRSAARGVTRHGAIIKTNTGQPGQSPYLKVMREHAVILRGLLADLGLTPAARRPNAPADDEDDDLTA